MPADYTNWPQSGDVQDILSSVGVQPRNPRRIEAIRNNVIADIAQRTHRQFVADTTDHTRVYDGTGTAEQEIDEIVSLTGVVVIGLADAPGYSLDNVHTISEQSKPITRLVVSVGSLPALSMSGILLPYRLRFPVGRQNIAVTGRFGYGLTIPADLWDACAGEIAHRLIKESIYNGLGQVVERTAGDEREKYAANSAELLGLHDAYERALACTYKRGQGRRLRNLFPKMV